MQYKTHRKYHHQTPTDYNTETVSVYTSKNVKTKDANSSAQHEENITERPVGSFVTLLRHHHLHTRYHGNQTISQRFRHIIKPDDSSQLLARPNQTLTELKVQRIITRRTASTDRTARRQFQATGQPVSRTQASDAMTSRLPRYETKCVQRRCFQCGSVPLRSDVNGTELPPANV